MLLRNPFKVAKDVTTGLLRRQDSVLLGFRHPHTESLRHLHFDCHLMRFGPLQNFLNRRL